MTRLEYEALLEPFRVAEDWEPTDAELHELFRTYEALSPLPAATADPVHDTGNPDLAHPPSAPQLPERPDLCGRRLDPRAPEAPSLDRARTSVLARPTESDEAWVAFCVHASPPEGMTLGIPRWRIELRAAIYPQIEWVELRHGSGKYYRYVDKVEAELALAALLAVQPHAIFRITSI